MRSWLSAWATATLGFVGREGQVAAVVGELELEELVGGVAFPEVEPAAATAAGEADPEAFGMMGARPRRRR